MSIHKYDKTLSSNYLSCMRGLIIIYTIPESALGGSAHFQDLVILFHLLGFIRLLPLP